MKERWQKISALALAAAMVLGGMSVFADGESNANALTIGASQPPVMLMSNDTEPLVEDNVPYQYYNGSGFASATAESCTPITANTTAWSSGWYVASGDVTINARVEATGDVHLILTDDCTLTINGGIHLPTGNSLTIYGQEGNTGSLRATSNNPSRETSGANAGIGGNGGGYGINGESGGKVTIHGGQVTATGGSSVNQYAYGGGGAGIGGGGGGFRNYGGAGDSVAIYGGTVNASGGSSSYMGGGGAGIGGGGSSNSANGGDGGTAIILSQEVQATGGRANPSWATNGADIGGGGSYYYNQSGKPGQGICPTEDGGFEVYGDLTLPVSIAIPEGATLTVPEGASLTVPEGVTLTVPEGTTLNVEGTLTNDGSIVKKGNLEGSVTGDGEITDGTTGEQQPSQPGKPAEPATGTAATSDPETTVQQMEQRERPDPQDVEATERYHFWMDVKADLRAAVDGERLRVHVPADYTNMPASVMEQIRLLDTDVTVDLRWNGQRLLITPATAQQKTALKAYWTFDQLCELYAQAQFESM